MKKLIILACALSLLAVANVAWSQSDTKDPQQQQQGSPPSNYYGPGMMGSGGGPGYGMGPGMMGYGGGPGYGMGPGMMGSGGGYGRGMMGYGRGPGYGPGMGPSYQGWQSMSPKDREALQQMYHQFSLDTLELRKKLVATQLELETLWASPNPDHKKVQAVANELAAQQAELAKKGNQFLVNCRQKFGDRGWSCPGVGAGY